MSHRELSEVEAALKEATKAAEKNSKMAAGKLDNAAGDEQSVQVIYHYFYKYLRFWSSLDYSITFLNSRIIKSRPKNEI